MKKALNIAKTHPAARQLAPVRVPSPRDVLRRAKALLSGLRPQPRPVPVVVRRRPHTVHPLSELALGRYREAAGLDGPSVPPARISEFL